MLLQCANPVDEPPLRWRSNVQVPITNEKFLIGEELDNLFIWDGLDILNVDLRTYYNDPSRLQPDTILGDTVVFSASKSDSAEFESHEKPFEDKLYHVTLGAIPVTGAPEKRDTILVPAVAAPFDIPFTVTLDSVYAIDFYDTASNTLEINLENRGGATFSSLRIGIAGVDTAFVGTLGPGASATASLDLAGKSVTHTALLHIDGASDGATADSLIYSFSLNGVTASRMQVNDHLVDFTVEFVNPYELTDTVNVDYIDIADGFFSYDLRNYTSLGLEIRGIHQHMWTTTFSLQHDLETVDDLTGLTAADSMDGFVGTITDASTVIAADAEATFRKANISACRLFPEWDSTLLKSVTKVRYIVSTEEPRGDTVTLRASDSLVFAISSHQFKFKELQGVLTEMYERQSDTQKVAINLPWNESRDSLKGNFILQQVWGDILMSTGMPPRSFLDSLSIDFVAYAPESTSVQDSMSTVLVNVGPDSSFFRTIDITDVANTFSDSVGIAVKVFVPKGTRMRIVNDLDPQDENFDQFIGRMIIHVATSYRLNAKLDWEVRGTVNMDLGSSRFAVPEAMRYLHKLEDRSAVFEMWLTNNSNLNMSLLALVAPDTLMDTLDSLSMNEVYARLKHPTAAEGHGFVKLFGDTGISIPKRDTSFTQHNIVELNDQQLEIMAGADSLDFRWWIQFREQDRDALSDTDYVDMRSRLRVEGINTTDSLLIWE